MSDINTLVEQLGNLTVLQIADLVKALEEKWGVSAAAPVAVAAVVAEADALCATSSIRAGRLALGGRSFGGRMCSMAVAEGLPAAGLVLLSYPLHPPGRPEVLRVDHFADIAVPCLFVSGDRDPFGTPEELERELRRIAAPVELVIVPGAHDPRGQDERIAAEVRRWVRSLR